MNQAFLTAILFLISAGAAQADEPVMLFVNLNYSSEELAAANRIAKERGEKIIVLPPLEDFKLPEKVATPLRNKIAALLKAVAPDEAHADFENALWGAGLNGADASNYLKKVSGTPAQIEQLKKAMNQYKEVYSQIVAMETNRGNITDQIVDEMRALKRQHQTLDTVIISGHSDGSRIDGETTLRLEDTDLEQLTKDAPEFFQQPKDVLILGCYSNTPMAHERWKGQNYFQNASLIVGQGARAPIRTNPLSADYIYSTLHAADALDRRLANRKMITKASDVMAELRHMAVAPNAAIDYCGYYVDFAPKQSKDGCDLQWTAFQAQYLVVQRNYLDTPTQDPQDRQRGLRPFYDSLQSLCPIKEIADPSFRDKSQALIQPATDHTIRLIFWWQLQPRYATTYAPQIDKASTLLKQNGIDFTLPKIDGNLSRVEFMKTMGALDDKIMESLIARLKSSALNSNYFVTGNEKQSKEEFLKTKFRVRDFIYEKMARLDLANQLDPNYKSKPEYLALAQLKEQVNQLWALKDAAEDAYGPLKELDNRIPLGWL